MRHVDRSEVPLPSTLESTAVRGARRAIEEILILPDDERRQRRAPYDRSPIHARDVRESLRKLFANKCAYCESAISPQSDGDVDHFRPLHVGSDGSAFDAEHHYAWLAYEWGNLYLTCRECNIAKGNRFPVKGPRSPLLLSFDEIHRFEKPLLLDPCRDDPARHLMFYWSGEVRSRTERGAMTIDCLALNRERLVQDRRSTFEGMLSLLEMDISFAGQQYRDGGAYQGALEGLLQEFTENLAESMGLALDQRVPIFDQLTELTTNASREELASNFAGARASVPVVREGQVAPKPLSDRSSFSYPASSTERPPMVSLGPRKITIRGFKAIRDLTLTLLDQRPDHDGAPCLMLLGENACGKSSVLEAIALALAGTEAASQLVTTPSDLLRRKSKNGWALFNADPVEIKIEFYASDRLAELSVDPIRLVFEGSYDPVSFVLAYGPRRFFLKRRSRKPAENIRSLFDLTSSIRDPSDWLRNLGDRYFFPLARAMREILNLNQQDSLVRDESLGVCVVVKGQRIPLERMSEGYKSLFALAVDIMRRLLHHWENLEEAQAVVLIDEIETHLHPRWKMKVMSGFRRAMPRVTFIATTHDPLCLRGMDDGEVHVLMRNSDHEIEQLQDLPNLKGMRADQILTSDYFGLSSTADPEAEAALAGYVAGAAGSIEIELAGVRDYLSNTVIGADSAALMVAEEAVKQYLRARERADADDISNAKKHAIQTIVESLDRISRGER